MCKQTQETLTVKEVREILNIGTNSAYNLIHSKAFPVIKIGQSYRIPKGPFTHGWRIPVLRNTKPNLQL